jgi:hypothetical protein
VVQAQCDFREDVVMKDIALQELLDLKCKIAEPPPRISTTCGLKPIPCPSIVEDAGEAI